MKRRHIEKHKVQKEIRELNKTINFYNIINSTNIENKDCRKIFDNSVQYAYGEVLDEYSEKSINAIMVNDIRHNCSNYDQNLKQIYRIHRSDSDYIQYKNSILNKISNAYPFLIDECNKQKRRCDMVKICN